MGKIIFKYITGIKFFIFLFCASGIYAQNHYYLTPEFFNSQQGLSSSKITCITKDDKGFIWIGTDDGLNKYDGHSFTVYKTIEGDSTSLFSNHILSLYSDSRQCLWVGTSSGLQYYDSSTDNFINANLNQPGDFIRNQCNNIFEDSKGNMWFDYG